MESSDEWSKNSWPQLRENSFGILSLLSPFLSFSFFLSLPPFLYLSLAHTNLLSLFSLSSNVLRFMLFYVFLSSIVTLLQFLSFSLSVYPSLSLPPSPRSIDLPPPLPTIKLQSILTVLFSLVFQQNLIRFSQQGVRTFYPSTFSLERFMNYESRYCTCHRYAEVPVAHNLGWAVFFWFRIENFDIVDRKLLFFKF